MKWIENCMILTLYKSEFAKTNHSELKFNAQDF